MFVSDLVKRSTMKRKMVKFSKLYHIVLSILLMLMVIMTVFLKSRVEIHHKNSKFVMVRVSPSRVKQAEGCRYQWEVPSLPMMKYYEKNRYKKTDIVEKKTPKWIYSNPKYKLDPNKFLLTVLTRGPNNQVIELRNSMLLAILLNRTFVVPTFHPHRSNEEVSTFDDVNPLHRVDVASMCQLVSCVHLDDFREYCDNEIDVVMEQPMNKDITMHSVKILGELHGMNVSTNVEYLPGSKIDMQRKNFLSIKEAQRAFSSEGKCGFVPYLYVPNVERHETQDLMFEIEKSTDLPPYIHQIAEDFISYKVGHNKFISVHWRYNKNDFQLRCKEADMGLKEITASFKKMCTLLDQLDENAISEAFLKYAINRSKILRTNVFYVATPPSEIPLMLKVAKKMNEKGFKMFTHADLDNYLKEQQTSKKCPWIQSLYFDIQSNVEMAICARGQEFVKSQYSSWSTNVHRLRHNMGVDNRNKLTVLEILGYKRNTFKAENGM